MLGLTRTCAATTQHRGVPNNSAEPRPNIVLIYRRWGAPEDIAAAGCIESPETGLIFSENTRQAFGAPRPNVNRNIRFIPGPGVCSALWPSLTHFLLMQTEGPSWQQSTTLRALRQGVGRGEQRLESRTRRS